MATDPEQTVRACFRAYETKDRQALEAIIADDFTFTSPIDDAIDRKTYFERCWPNSEHLVKFDIEKLLVDGDEVFVRYTAVNKDGSTGGNVETFVVRDGKIHSVHVFFGSDTADAANTEEISSIIETWMQGIRRKDVGTTTRHFTSDAVSFPLAPPLVEGGDAERNLAGWFATFKGPIGNEHQDLTISAHGNTAFAHMLAHLTGTKTTGEEIDLWFRMTLGLRKTGPHWKITHLHESVPFLMDGSNKAALDLRP